MYVSEHCSHIKHTLIASDQASATELSSWIQHQGAFPSILILLHETANLLPSVLFCIKGIFDQRIIGMTHHTRPYTFIIIYLSEKDEKAEMFVVLQMKGSLLVLMQGFET